MYTAAQQAKLDAAKAKLTAATAAKDGAYNDMSGYYDGYMVNCKYKWSVPAKGDIWNSEGCDGNVNAQQHPGCGSKNTCQSRVVEYNGKVSAYSTALNSFNTAQANYDKVLKEVTTELQNDPEAQSQIAAAQAGAQAMGTVTIIKWVIVGVVVFVLTVGFVYFKFLRKAAGKATAAPAA